MLSFKLDRHCLVIPDAGSVKYPDASLVTSLDDIEIAFEVGFGQSLKPLFNIASVPKAYEMAECAKLTLPSFLKRHVDLTKSNTSPKTAWGRKKQMLCSLLIPHMTSSRCTLRRGSNEDILRRNSINGSGPFHIHNTIKTKRNSISQPLLVDPAL